MNDTPNTQITNQPSANSVLEKSNPNEKISNNDEEEIEYLRTQLTRITTCPWIRNFMKHNFDPSYSQWRLLDRLLKDSEEYQVFFTHLKAEFQRVESLVSEANIISNEMQRQIIYQLISQIPASYLKPNERSTSNLCELAVQVKRGNSSLQMWSIEKFEQKLNQIKTIYHQWEKWENKTKSLKQELKRNNPFYDEKSDQLVGVANIYLKALFYGSKHDYLVPIINTQGKGVGSLHVVLDQTNSPIMNKLSGFQINSTTCGSMSEGISIDADEQSLDNYRPSQHSFEDEGIDESSTLSNGKADQITIKFAIKEARDLPESNAENVMCRYTFINPKLDQTIFSIKPSNNDEIEHKSHRFSFNHENEYTFPITDDFLSTCFQSSVSIEVWYQYNSKSDDNIEDDSEEEEVDNRRNAVLQELIDQWKNVKRHVQLRVEIQELDAMGEWVSVDVNTQKGIISGGIYRLKQGQSKRLVTQLRILPRSDGMPMSLHDIRSVEIGSISTRKFDAPLQLDSYQDEELQYLRDGWLNLIQQRKHHIQSQMMILSQQTNKSPNEIQKENILLEQLANLTEECDIAILTPTGSGIPGSPAAWNPPIHVEIHRPLIFLNLDPHTMTPSEDTAGLRGVLYEENKTEMFQLSLIQNASNQTRAIAQWDPTIHQSNAMNQVTPNDTLIYLIVKVIVMITKPVPMEIVLRKRIAVTISKAEGWWPEKTLKNLLRYKTYKQTSVVFEIVSNIPRSLHSIDDHNSTDSKCLSQEHIEKCIRYASTIDSFLLRDRLRQELLVAENSMKQQIIRKATSTPNITTYKRKSNVFSTPNNIRRETPPDNPYSAVPNETMSSSIESELNSSSPSMSSRSSFIKEQQLQSNEKSSFCIKYKIDLDDDKDKAPEQSLDEKYMIKPTQPSEPSLKQNQNYSIDSHVIVNTGHSIYNKPGRIRFSGTISGLEGVWYGIELEEPVGKNNGSRDGRVYFVCPKRHGVFVRREKLRLIDRP